MRKIGDDKAGQNMSLTTILIIALGLVVVIILIFGVSTGWRNLWEKVTSFGAGENNINTVEQACLLACNTQSQNDYCTRTRTLNFGELRTVNISGDPEVVKSVSGTCNEVAMAPENYNGTVIVECPGLCD